jgi:isoleucyl-tRNA synthetase
MSPDYRDTVFLPRTEFPMKAGLPQREPGWVERWERMDLYARLRRESPGRPTPTGTCIWGRPSTRS